MESLRQASYLIFCLIVPFLSVNTRFLGSYSAFCVSKNDTGSAVLIGIVIKTGYQLVNRTKLTSYDPHGLKVIHIVLKQSEM